MGTGGGYTYKAGSRTFLINFFFRQIMHRLKASISVLFGDQTRFIFDILVMF